jgi:hypothetical protein
MGRVTQTATRTSSETTKASSCSAQAAAGSRCVLICLTNLAHRSPLTTRCTTQYPILSGGKTYTGGSPGADRVVFNTAGTYCA